MPISAETPVLTAVTPRELIDLGVATVHEAAGRRHLARGLDLLLGPAFCGPAVTVALPAGDNLGIHAALREAPAGTVLCVASGGRGAFGVLGELIVAAARARGLSGLVVDDGIRDLDLLESPPSIAARGVGARGTVKRRFLSLGQPVAIGGILVRPGDWVLADRDGVCLVPPERLEGVLATAHARTAREDVIRAALVGGRTTVEALGLEPLLREVEGQGP